VKKRRERRGTSLNTVSEKGSDAKEGGLRRTDEVSSTGGKEREKTFHAAWGGGSASARVLKGKKRLGPFWRGGKCTLSFSQRKVGGGVR